MTYQAPRRSNAAPWLIGGLVVLLAIAAVLLFVLLNQRPGAPLASQPGSANPSPSPTLNADLLGRRLTVLVIGIDVNAKRAAAGAGVNTDSLMLASINEDQSELTMVSVPRDMTNIPMPDGSTWQRKVNAIEAEKGVDTLVDAMSRFFDVPIDYYVQVDMDDLVKLVDAVDGVEVNPKQALNDPTVHLDIAAGRQTLDGPTALAYARTRHIDEDYGRARRQQEVVLDLVSRLVDPKTDVDVASLLDGLSSLKTDLPLDELPTLIEIGRRAQSADVSRQVLGPPRFVSFEGDRGDGRGYLVEPNIEAIRAYVQKHIGSGAG